MQEKLSSVLNTSLAESGALAHRLQQRTACKIQIGHQGARKLPTGSERGLSLGYQGVQTTLAKWAFGS